LPITCAPPSLSHVYNEQGTCTLRASCRISRGVIFAKRNDVWRITLTARRVLGQPFCSCHHSIFLRLQQQQRRRPRKYSSKSDVLRGERNRTYGSPIAPGPSSLSISTLPGRLWWCLSVILPNVHVLTRLKDPAEKNLKICSRRKS
jgi:hypothetical protein